VNGKVYKFGSMDHNEYSRAMRPTHFMFDGDTIFALATGRIDTDISLVGMLSARVMERAVVRAAKEAIFLGR